jgi:hypothetical protein
VGKAQRAHQFIEAKMVGTAHAPLPTLQNLIFGSPDEAKRNPGL